MKIKFVWHIYSQPLSAFPSNSSHLIKIMKSVYVGNSIPFKAHFRFKSTLISRNLAA